MAEHRPPNWGTAWLEARRLGADPLEALVGFGLVDSDEVKPSTASAALPPMHVDRPKRPPTPIPSRRDRRGPVELAAVPELAKMATGVMPAAPRASPPPPVMGPKRRKPAGSRS